MNAPDVIAPDMEAKLLSGWTRNSLADLREHWGDAYVFGVEGTQYAAWRKDGTGEIMRADDEQGLRKMVRADANAKDGEPVGEGLYL